MTKIHRVLEFNQGTWLKDFIDKNNELIKNSKNSFEKEIFQMMNENAIVQSGYEPLIRRLSNIEKKKGVAIFA